MHPRRYRGIDPSDPSNNRFRRMSKLCGLKQRETADFLGVSIGTVEAKICGRRGITEAEEGRFVALYEAIVAGGPLPEGTPEGAVRMRDALVEAAAIEREILARDPTFFVRDARGSRGPSSGQPKASSHPDEMDVFLASLR